MGSLNKLLDGMGADKNESDSIVKSIEVDGPLADVMCRILMERYGNQPIPGKGVRVVDEAHMKESQQVDEQQLFAIAASLPKLDHLDQPNIGEKYATIYALSDAKLSATTVAEYAKYAFASKDVVRPVTLLSKDSALNTLSNQVFFLGGKKYTGTATMAESECSQHRSTVQAIAKMTGVPVFRTVQAMMEHLAKG